jgi:sortase (surface protein transpeptidase)
MDGGWPMRRTGSAPLLLGALLALLLTTCSSLPAVGDAPAAVTIVDVDRAPDPLVAASRAPMEVAEEDEAAPPPPEADPVGEHAGREPSPPAVEEAVDDTSGTEEAEATAPAPDPDAAVAEEEAGETAASARAEEAHDAGGTTDASLPVDVPPAAGAKPARVVVPRIGVDNPLVPVGLHPDKSLVVPDQAHVAGWYTGRPQPGATGPAIIAGHNQWGGRLGVFYRLHTLSAGDTVEVHNDDGSVVRFEIERLEQHPKSAFPTERVYGRTDRAEVRVITCGGHFDRSRGSHVDNIIAFGVRIG